MTEEDAGVISHAAQGRDSPSGRKESPPVAATAVVDRCSGSRRCG